MKVDLDLDPKGLGAENEGIGDKIVVQVVQVLQYQQIDP